MPRCHEDGLSDRADVDGANVTKPARAIGIAGMDNRAGDAIVTLMSGFRFGCLRLLTLVLVLAVFAGAVGLGAMNHPAPDSGTASAEHPMHDMADMAKGGTCDLQDRAGNCAMAVCCYFAVSEPRTDYVGVAVIARYARRGADPALQSDPDRADKPPRLT